jgi:hypothetical protein
MPDDHTVASSAEAHKIMMCAVGSTPAQLGNTSGAGKSRSTHNNNERCTELRSDLGRLSTQSRSGKRKNDQKKINDLSLKNMFCWILANRNFKK